MAMVSHTHTHIYTTKSAAIGKASCHFDDKNLHTNTHTSQLKFGKAN